MSDNMLLILLMVSYFIFTITSIKLNLDEIINEEEEQCQKIRKLDELYGRSRYNQ